MIEKDDYEGYIDAFHKLENEAQVIYRQAVTATEMMKSLQDSADWLLTGWRRSLRTIISDLQKGDSAGALLFAEVELDDLDRRLQNAAVKVISGEVGWESEENA